MSKTVKLKDETEVLIRPMASDDLERSAAFFRALPEEDRAALRRDVTKLEVIRERIHELETGHAKRLVAVIDSEIVADGAIELTSYGWEQHVGELRLIIARPYQRKGLGMLMARELYALAASAGIEEIVVKMMRSQTSACNIFRRLGFCEEVVLRRYAKDRAGKKQDLVLMRCELEGLWHQMEEVISELDWHGFRT